MARPRKTQGQKTSNRCERMPLGTIQQKLTTHDIPKGKKARWVNDVGDRVQAALNGGYDFLNDPKVKVGDDVEDGNDNIGSSHISKSVGTKEDGSAMTAYLMVIDEKLYNQDQAAKQAELDKVDEAIKGGKFMERPGEKRYIPKEGIKIVSRGARR